MPDLRLPKPLKIYFDGGARPNPGRIEVAVVARGKTQFSDDLGDGTSSDAEWLALIAAIEVAHTLGVVAFDLLGDSRSIVEQANGTVPCRSPSARAYLAQFNALAAIGAPRRTRWIARAQNLAGIALDGRQRRGR